MMSADLASSPVTALMAQACGDMHVANFGWFASAERNLVFGINGFDETLPGPWKWDLKRLNAAVARFAEAYADQTDRDYDALVKGAKEKRIPVAKTA